MNTIILTGNVIRYKETNGRLWILIRDSINEKSSVFSMNLVGEQVDLLAGVIREGIVLTIKGNVAGVDTGHGFVVVYNPVFIKAFQKTTTLEEILSGDIEEIERDLEHEKELLSIADINE